MGSVTVYAWDAFILMCMGDPKKAFLTVWTVKYDWTGQDLDCTVIYRTVPYCTVIFLELARGAVAVTTLLFAVLRADHCHTPLAPLRGVQGFRGATRRTPLP